jgi:hypothetical protein
MTYSSQGTPPSSFAPANAPANAFASRTQVLFEGQQIDQMGLASYVKTILDRRWTQPEFRKTSFAISSRKIENAQNSIGNNSFICTIILAHPGMQIAIIDINYNLTFAQHCMPAIVPPYFASLPIGLSVCVGIDLILINILHPIWSQKTCDFAAIGVPRSLISIILGICRAYGTQIKLVVSDNKVVHLHITADEKSRIFPLFPTSLCPWEYDCIKAGTFFGCSPSIWSSIPLQEIRDATYYSSPILSKHIIDRPASEPLSRHETPPLRTLRSSFSPDINFPPSDKKIALSFSIHAKNIKT